MILNDTTNTIERRGVGRETSFTVLNSAKAFDILSGRIYSDKIGAVIREISTNAADAHVESGCDQPFQVHLPTRLEPWFSVRDFGFGMSDEDCMGLYTTFFQSTKTHRNDLNGCFGLGSKSFFSYTDSATVTSVYGGMKRCYTAFRDEENVPHFCLLSEEESDEPSGLNVVVGVDSVDIYSFQDKAVSIYRRFSQKPITNISSINDSINTPHEYAVDTPTFKILNSAISKLAISGNVAYTIPNEVIPPEFASINFELHFDIGDISFLPGREALELNTKTRQSISAAFSVMSTYLRDKLSDDIEQCKTLFDARIKWSELKSGGLRAFIRDKTEWKGETLFDSNNFQTGNCIVNIPDALEVQKFFTRRYKKSVKRGRTHHVDFTEDVKVFIMAVGGISRITQAIKNGSLSSCYLVYNKNVAELAKILGCDPGVFISTNTLPCRSVIRGYSGPTFQTHELQNGAWIGSSHKIVDGGVYVEYHDGGATGYPHIETVGRTLSSLGLKLPPVFGIKRAGFDTKRFRDNKNKWISLNTWLHDSLSKINSTYSIPSGIDQSLFELLADVSKVSKSKSIKEIVGLYKSELGKRGIASKVRYLFNKANVQIKNDTTLNDLMDTIMSKCPMLSFIGLDYSDTDLLVISQYIKTQLGE